MKPPTCAICGKLPVARFSPFCSLRCADADLGRWFGEVYRVPDTTADPDAMTGSDDADDNLTG